MQLQFYLHLDLGLPEWDEGNRDVLIPTQGWFLAKTEHLSDGQGNLASRDPRLRQRSP